MPLQSPSLDDRTFRDLVEEAHRRIEQSCPGWTDRSPGDPGMMLTEVFAHLTEVMIYRLNRVPDKAYVEFLRLIGVTLHPPSAAQVRLRLSISRPQDSPVEIPRGTRVTAARAGSGAEPPVFVTAGSAVIEPGQTSTETEAYHCDLVEGELVGAGTGMPGLTVSVRRAPVVAPTPDGLDIVVGVETDAGELDVHTRAVHHEGRVFRVWEAVDSFAAVDAEPHVYVLDRLAGTITFAPALRGRDPEGGLEDAPKALAAVPEAGREIRVWYRSGGGPEGNVAANILTTLKDPVRGVTVTNPSPAKGGRSAETLENALRRGPQEIHSLRRAITARDFELVAMQNRGAVERAHAFTKAELWTYAPPGTAEVRVVPHVAETARTDGPVTVEILAEHETDAALAQIQKAIDLRRPLGTTCVVEWARYKPVRITAHIVVHREEEPAAVRRRVLTQLYRTISPLTSPEAPGWPFGQALTVWHVYKIIGGEPGVKSVSHVRLLVDAVPDAGVKALCADAFQPRTWYAAAGDTLYRSVNDGHGWEPAGRFPGEEITLVKAYPIEASSRPGRAGLVAVAAQTLGTEPSYRVHFSRDCGETWEPGRETRFAVTDMAWAERDGIATLLLAAEVGLYELKTVAGSVPIQVLVDPENQDLGFVAVAVSTDVWGGTSVAVAGRGERGVFLSSEAGKPGTFSHIGLQNELVRVLEMQHLGPHRYLWAGIGAPGNLTGKGCFRWRVTGSADSPEGWRGYHAGWEAGGCRSLAFQGPVVFAASHRRGVLRLDTQAHAPEWEASQVNCGLPMRDVSRLHPVDAVAADAEGRLVLAAGEQGVYRSSDGGATYAKCSSKVFSDEVTLPRTWLFCAQEHEISVIGEDEAGRD